jgi:hypothetical protein
MVCLPLDAPESLVDVMQNVPAEWKVPVGSRFFLKSYFDDKRKWF